MALTTAKAVAAASSVMPRTLVFLAHRTRPKPRKSGSPSTVVGATAGTGGLATFDFLRNNMPHSKRMTLTVPSGSQPIMVASALIFGPTALRLGFVNHPGPLIRLNFAEGARIRLMRGAR